MKYCGNCKVSVNSGKDYCPLCYCALSADDEQKSEDYYPDLEGKARQSSKNEFRNKLLLFLSIAAALLCLFINLVAWRGILWSLIVTLGILLAWEIIGFLILGKKNPGFKVVCNMLALSAALTALDGITGWHQWSVNLLLPFIIIGSTFTITVILYKNRSKWREYMIYQLIITLNGFIPAILYLCGFAKIFWPVGAGLLYALLTFIGIWIFAEKQLGNELEKRFHL